MNLVGVAMFDLNYEVLLADNEESKNIHYNIRYQVYCHEKGYESQSKCHDNLETDAYDHRSVHFIVRCKKTGDWVAAMRLVEGAAEDLPFASKTKLNAEHVFYGEDIFEISRMCVLKSFRGAPKVNKLDIVPNEGGDEATLSESKKLLDSRRAAQNECAIMLGLIRAVYGFGLYNDVNHFIALMSASLARILKLNGFSFDIVGEKCELNGIRRPYYFNTQNASEDFTKMQNKCGDFFTNDASYALYSDWCSEVVIA